MQMRLHNLYMQEDNHNTKGGDILKVIKNIIIILIICIIFVSISLVIYNKLNPKELRTDEVEGDFDVLILTESLEKLNIRNRYYVVQNIVNNYYKLLCDLNKEETNESTGDANNILEQKEINKQKLYSYFDKSYINYKKLNLNNIEKTLGVYNNLYVDINSIKYIESVNLAVYFINGQIIEKDTKQTNDFTLMAVIDSQNSTFNLYTEDFIKEKGFNEFDKESFDLLGYTKIEKRTFNNYSYEFISDDTYCNSLFESFINRLKYNVDYSFNVLDKTYKNKRFDSIEEYKKYVNNLNLNGLWLDQFKVNKNGKNKEYICIDNKGKMWIFEENTVMDYNAILDTYTIDLPQFTENYNNANSQEKTALNIKKIVDALNDQDYKYVYSKLADSFKNENFKTLESFQEYAKKTFEIENEVEFNRYVETANYSTFTITLKNNNKEITKTIIMDLQEGTNFVFSFNVD